MADSARPVPERTGSEIAIVGMACRFPGADGPEEFWRNLVEGRESIARLTPQEMESAGVDPRLLQRPEYVGAAAALEGIELFDAAFFDCNPREAELMDPQQRLFLECAWEALEQAGYTASKYRGSIGVFAGGRMSTYLLTLLSDPELMATLDPLQVGLGNDTGLLGMLVSYKLNLTGPSYFMQSACSTALVTVHLARQSLLGGECDLALAGGVAIDVPQKKGYLYQRGGILSADGRVRAFDARASGTLFGNGVGVVALKRLETALEDGDSIYAVVRGSAANNDGSSKASFTAPSVDGQAEVILAALVDAELPAGAIGYVEAHGTGTSLGDPIEVRALTKAFRASTDERGFCLLGSVKSNLGHLDAAAGMPALIKTALALDRRQIPPSLHYEAPNPEIDFESGPFRVNTALRPWEGHAAPRRAGVSAFGFGGTNCHVILEEAPPQAPGSPSGPWQLLLLSARSDAALDAAARNLSAWLREHEQAEFADVCFTLQVGRRDFAQRLALVCASAEDAAAALAEGDARRLLRAPAETAAPPVAFLFPGQGAQTFGMAAEVYAHEPVFREHFERCATLLEPQLGVDLRALLYRAGEAGKGAAEERLAQTWLAQPALFSVEYALARLWMAWGVRPQALLGHSLGEYVAACLSGVFALEDALFAVAARGRLMQDLEPGAMLAVALPEEELRPLLPEGVEIAAVNAPARCVASGPLPGVARLEDRVVAYGAECRRLRVSHAFHSAMMDPALPRFREALRRLSLRAPRIPFLSNLTGTWIEPAAAADPEYWVRHLRGAVRFADGLRELLGGGPGVWLEVGPGQTLGGFARELLRRGPAAGVLASLPRPGEKRSELAALLGALARLWLAGVPVDWQAFHAHERRRRVALPTYPFERQRFWIEPRRGARLAGPAAGSLSVRKNPNVDEWFHVPAWERSRAPAPRSEPPAERQPWLLFVDACGLGRALGARLEGSGQQVVTVTAGGAYARTGPREFRLDPARAEDYQRLLAEAAQPFRTIVHCWSVTGDGPAAAGRERFAQAQRLGYTSLLLLGRALAAQGSLEPATLIAVSDRLHDVSGAEACEPEKAPLLGPCVVLPQEQPRLTCRSVDVVVPAPEELPALAEMLLWEALADTGELAVAYRGARRHVQVYTRVSLPAGGRPARGLRRGGLYVLTGGLGNVGLRLADNLARLAQPVLVLVGRSAFPEREAWPAWLEAHDQSDVTSRRIRRLLALEQAGARVQVRSADVADEARMRALLDDVERRHGPVHGVIHAAGVLTGRSIYRPATEIGWEESEEQFRPKAYGLYALERALLGRRPDFCLLISSNAAILGGLGFVAYAAANAFMDAFALDRSRAGATAWISADWDEWPADPDASTALRNRANEFAMTPEEADTAFERVVTRAEPGQIMVATGDVGAGQAGLPPGELLRRLRQFVAHGAAAARGPQSVHARPDLPTAYLAPRDETERCIADLWRGLLGLEQVGVHDDFFELGGHSLLGMQLVSRLRDALGVDLELRQLFEDATVAGLAATVLKLRLAASGAERQSQLLEQIRALSDEEIEKALAAESGALAALRGQDGQE